jgi:hypothetical protein
VVPAGWTFGLTFASNLQFKWGLDQHNCAKAQQSTMPLMLYIMYTACIKHFAHSVVGLQVWYCIFLWNFVFTCTIVNWSCLSDSLPWYYYKIDREPVRFAEMPWLKVLFVNLLWEKNTVSVESWKIRIIREANRARVSTTYYVPIPSPPQGAPSFINTHKPIAVYILYQYYIWKEFSRDAGCPRLVGAPLGVRD